MVHTLGNGEDMIRVKLTDETGTRPDSAKVRVYDGDALMAQVGAYITTDQGADGRYYPVVTLRLEPQSEEDINDRTG